MGASARVRSSQYRGLVLSPMRSGPFHRRSHCGGGNRGTTGKRWRSVDPGALRRQSNAPNCGAGPRKRFAPRLMRAAPLRHRGGGNGPPLLPRCGHRCQRRRSRRVPPPEQRAEVRRLGRVAFSVPAAGPPRRRESPRHCHAVAIAVSIFGPGAVPAGARRHGRFQLHAVGLIATAAAGTAVATPRPSLRCQEHALVIVASSAGPAS